MTAVTQAFASFRERLREPGEAPPSDEIPDEERARRARQAFVELLDRRTAVDLETCIHCGMCAEACHFYIATGDERYAPVYKFEPLRRTYKRELSPLRWLYRPFVRAVDAADLAAWQELVYDACTGCGRCDMMCPMGINLSSAIGIVREGLARAGMVPDDLRILQSEQHDRQAVFGVDAAALRAAAGEIAAATGPLPLDNETADVLLLTTALDVRVFRGALEAAVKILRASGADWTLSSDAFEAANVGLISGDRKVRRKAMQSVVSAAERCRASVVVVPESGHAYQALRWEAADELGRELPFEVLSLPEFAARQHAAGKLALDRRDGGAVTYHDPCRMARHGGVFEEPRQLLEAMGYELREAESNRRENLCCGGGCGEYTIRRGARIRQQAFELKRRDLDAAGGDAVVVGCSNCRVNLMIGAEESGWTKPVASLAETIAEHIAE